MDLDEKFKTNLSLQESSSSFCDVHPSGFRLSNRFRKAKINPSVVSFPQISHPFQLDGVGFLILTFNSNILNKLVVMCIFA